jgi:hypothetical protein
MKRLSTEQASRISVTLSAPSGLTVVLLDEVGVPDIDASTYNSNIYCLSQEGGILWQIQAGEGVYERDSFISVSRMPDGSLAARRFFGNTYAIDQATGIAQTTGWSK